MSTSSRWNRWVVVVDAPTLVGSEPAIRAFTLAGSRADAREYAYERGFARTADVRVYTPEEWFDELRLFTAHEWDGIASAEAEMAALEAASRFRVLR